MKTKKQVENEVIVIGSDHYNALGVIRGLGECGVKPIFILLSDTDKCMSSHSKYIKKLYTIHEDEKKELCNFLLKNFKDINCKPVIIPTGDPIAKYLDENYDLIKDYFILQNINNKSGQIINMMEKMEQYKIAQKHNILMAKTYYFKMDEEINIDSLPEEVIIKPDLSADGNKTDIRIVKGKKNIKEALKEFKNKKYKSVLIQEFLKYEMEYGIMGYSIEGKVVVPGIFSNDYIYPTKRGNTSYARMFPIKDFPYDLKPIIKMISSIKYTGLFEVEMFLMNGKIYFNEMNFRNSANSHGYRGDKINYIYLYIKDLLGLDMNNDKKNVTNPYYYCIEPLHLKNVLEKKISIFRCICHIITSTKLIFNIKDMKPVIYKFIYAIKKRIKRRTNRH